MLVNLLWLVSLFKRGFISLPKRIFPTKKTLSELFMEQLEYPVCKKKLSEWITLKNPYGINDVSRSTFKTWSKDLKIDELVAIHRYYNTLCYFQKSRVVFHEILRRHSTPMMIFHKHGTKRFIIAHILLSQINNKYEKNKWMYNFALKLFLYISHPNRQLNYKKVIEGKTIALIGGGNEKNRGKEIDSTDLVARLNNFSINENQYNNIGKRTDIVFLRGESSVFLYETQGSKVLKPYDNICFSIKIKNLCNRFDAKCKSWSFSSDAGFYYGILNGVQSAIFDLIYHGASKIEIYGVDFNLEGYMPGYRPKEMVPVEFDLIFGAHPPHIQFLITKYFVKKGSVVPCGDAKDLFSLNYRSFAKIFDKKWSKENETI